MKIGILGTGHIGKTLARKLSSAGHEVRVANSRGPDSIAPDVLETGAIAVTAEAAFNDVAVAILSIPPTSFHKVRALVAMLPETSVLIDTSNYYPGRDGRIAAIDAGQVEGEWVGGQLGRPVIKAWNAICSDSFARFGQARGHADRIAVPVAGGTPKQRDVAIALVEDTGFDGFDAGPLEDSWRQQPGSPAYCTDLSYDEVGSALAAAEKSRLPTRRDIAAAVLTERMGDETINPPAEYLVRLNRALFT